MGGGGEVGGLWGGGEPGPSRVELEELRWYLT